MNTLAIFGDRSALPAALGGLTLEGVEVYPDPRLGFSARYGNGEGVKADAFLYDMGVQDMPNDLRSPQVVAWFQESLRSIQLAGERGIYRDLRLEGTRSLHLPPDAPDPFCHWASFSFHQEPGPGILFTGPRISHLALRIDRGHINKVRYTYCLEPTEADTGLRHFMIFLVEWTMAVRQFKRSEPPS